MNNQCQNCICYYTNWDEEVDDTMEEQAPGEECSCGMNPNSLEKCVCFQDVSDQ